jgi:hypothetical protein
MELEDFIRDITGEVRPSNEAIRFFLQIVAATEDQLGILRKRNDEVYTGQVQQAGVEH